MNLIDVEQAVHLATSNAINLNIKYKVKHPCLQRFSQCLIITDVYHSFPLHIYDFINKKIFRERFFEGETRYLIFGFTIL